MFAVGTEVSYNNARYTVKSAKRQAIGFDDVYRIVPVNAPEFTKPTRAFGQYLRAAA